jgi:hypothetical protein
VLSSSRCRGAAFEAFYKLGSGECQHRCRFRARSDMGGCFCLYVFDICSCMPTVQLPSLRGALTVPMQNAGCAAADKLHGQHSASNAATSGPAQTQVRRCCLITIDIAADNQADSKPQGCFDCPNAEMLVAVPLTSWTAADDISAIAPGPAQTRWALPLVYIRHGSCRSCKWRASGVL